MLKSILDKCFLDGYHWNRIRVKQIINNTVTELHNAVRAVEREKDIKKHRQDSHVNSCQTGEEQRGSI